MHMKELRYLQPNQIDPETLKDPVKLKAYFDWKYENFEEEYKVYCEEKRKLRMAFLDTLPEEKRDYYKKRRAEYLEKYLSITDRYEPIISRSLEDGNIEIIEKAMDEEREEIHQLEEEYKDIEFLLK